LYLWWNVQFCVLSEVLPLHLVCQKYRLLETAKLWQQLWMLTQVVNSICVKNDHVMRRKVFY
jgi:hypothetical protein